MRRNILQKFKRGEKKAKKNRRFSTPVFLSKAIFRKYNERRIVHTNAHCLCLNQEYLHHFYQQVWKM